MQVLPKEQTEWDQGREKTLPFHCHSIIFIACFVVPAVFQKAPAPCEETSASLGVVLQLITGYSFLKYILWMQIPGGNQNQAKCHEQRRASMLCPNHCLQDFAMNSRWPFCSELKIKVQCEQNGMRKAWLWAGRRTKSSSCSSSLQILPGACAHCT